MLINIIGKQQNELSKRIEKFTQQFKLIDVSRMGPHTGSISGMRMLRNIIGK